MNHNDIYRQVWQFIETHYLVAPTPKLGADAAAQLVPPETINVCFRRRDLASGIVCRLLDERHGIKISFADIGNEKYIRLVCVNPDLTVEFMADLLGKIKALS
jgi:hypothetical protein